MVSLVPRSMPLEISGISINPLKKQTNKKKQIPEFPRTENRILSKAFLFSFSELGFSVPHIVSLGSRR